MGQESDTMRYIDAQNITFSYEGQREDIFKNISFTIHRDHRLGLIGKNGSGKTTLFKLILGRIKPQRGTIWLWAIYLRNWYSLRICM